MKTFVRTHAASTYFVLTFAISWSAAFLAVGNTGGMSGTTPASDPRFAYAMIGMLLGPSLSGLFLTAFVSGGAGLRQYLSRLLTWRADATSWVVAVLIAPLVMAATLLVLSLVSPAFMPGILSTDQKSALLAVSLAVGLSAGIFEELGWTGFAIPTLRQRHGVLATGLIVGIWWSAWHLFPSIWARDAASGDLSLPIYMTATIAGVFAGYLTAFRMLMVWIYERSRSIFLGMVAHASFTSSLLILNPLDMTGANLQIYSFGLAAAVWLAVLTITVRWPAPAPMRSGRPAAKFSA
jgi:membrane protease YdiL (CAAX protease family)